MTPRLRSWVRGLFGRRKLEQDLSEEMRFHLQSRVDHWRAQGLTDDEARRHARIEFGGIERFKDECRQSLGLQLADELRADLGYGTRRLIRARGFTFVATLVLAAAIGANAAILSVLDAVMLQPLPVREPAALRELAWVHPGESSWRMRYDGSRRPFPGGGMIATSFSYPVYSALRDRSSSFSELFLLQQAEVTVGAAGRFERRPGLVVSGNFFSGLGAPVQAGRPLTPQDDLDSAPPAVVISHGFWQRAFGGRSDVVGQPFTVDSRIATIVGVTAPEFFGVDPGNTVDVYLPLAPFHRVIDNMDRRTDAEFWGFRVMGRVRPDRDNARSSAETEALMRQALPPQFASDPAGFTTVVVQPGGQGSDSLRRNYAEQLYLLLAIMAVTLLIACGNVAGLLLARTGAGVREMRVRLALGATRWRVVRQVLTESALLALLATGLGAVIALVTRASVLPLLTYDDGELSVPLDVKWVFVACLTSLFVVVTTLCGFLPAWRVAKAASPGATRSESGAGEGTRRLFAGRTLVAVQVTLSMVLLVGAGLFVRSLQNLRAEPLGFNPEGVLVFRLDATASGYDATPLKDLYERLGDRLSALQGVSAVSFSRYGLVSGGATTDTPVIPGDAAGAKGRRVHVHFVSPRHFETLGIPLKGGRDFTTGDRETAPRVAIVNESLAKLWPGGVALGSHILYEAPDQPTNIIGIVGDARFASLREPPPPTLYLPYRQHRQHVMTFSVRTVGEPAALSDAVRRTVDRVEPKLAIFDLRTQLEQIDESVRRERAFAYIASGFAGLALVLACVGLYGTLSYAVVGRTKEIGLRVALGASRREIVTMVLGQSLVPTLVGLAAGLGAALVTMPYLASMLFGLTPRDPAMLAIAAGALVLSALLAAWLPSRRAAAIQPTVALRAD